MKNATSQVFKISEKYKCNLREDAYILALERIINSTSRIMAENFAIKKLDNQERRKINLSKIYYSFVWAQIAFGIILFLFNIYEPKTLIILGAVINAFAMFVHIALVFWLNNKSLPIVFRAGLMRKIIIGIIFIFFGVFSLIVLWDNIYRLLI